MVLKEGPVCHAYVTFLFWWMISPLNYYVFCK